MIEEIICFLTGHKWHLYPEKATIHDYKVCNRCNKSVASSPCLTRGEIEYVNHMLINAINVNLISRMVDEKT